MKIIDSVAAVFCYENKILAVRRQSHLDVFPGYYSFPGGKIDFEDSRTQHYARFLRNLNGQKTHALVRKIQEELDYDLPREIAAGQVSSVKLLATALAPAIVPVRFRLHFFRIDLKTLPIFTPDAEEIEDTFWETPQQLLNRFHKGDALMVPPFRQVLEELSQYPHGSDFGDLSQQLNETNYIPRLELLSELQILPVPSNTCPSEKRTNAFLLGDNNSPKILINPSPKSHEVLERLQQTLRHDKVNAVFLTHHNHEYAPSIAKALEVPIWMSKDTLFRITKKHGSDYFSGLRVKTKKEGDKLTNWKSEAVRVYQVPGHDAGQLAIAPESLRWCIGQSHSK